MSLRHFVLRRQYWTAVLLLVGAMSCSYAARPTSTESGSGVGATGNMKFAHDTLGSGKHLVTVTAAPGFLETEGSIEQRVHVFATRHAAQTCPNGFDFVHDPNFDQRLARGFMTATKSYVFVCR